MLGEDAWPGHAPSLPLREEAARPAQTRAAPMFRRLAKLLGYFDRPRARRRAIGVALLLVAPTLFSGFALDDYVLLYRLGTESTSQWVGERSVRSVSLARSAAQSSA